MTRPSGMLPGVQRALGFTLLPTHEGAPCPACGQDLDFGVDRIGRMVESCRCGRHHKVYPGPKMRTREDDELEFGFTAGGDVARIRRKGKGGPAGGLSFRAL